MNRKRLIKTIDDIPARVDLDALARHVIRYDHIHGIQSVVRAIHSAAIRAIYLCAVQRKVVIIQIIGDRIISGTAADARLIDDETAIVVVQFRLRLLYGQRLLIQIRDCEPNDIRLNCIFGNPIALIPVIAFNIYKQP